MDQCIAIFEAYVALIRFSDIIYCSWQIYVCRKSVSLSSIVMTHLQLDIVDRFVHITFSFMKVLKIRM